MTVAPSAWPGELFDPPTPTMPAAVLRRDDGRILDLDVARWHGAACPDDWEVIARMRPPVLDIGCGPGRLLEALTSCGIEATGIDSCPGAVGASRARGGDAHLVDAFELVPREGEWATVVLLDGSIGIGGDVVALLSRVEEILCPGGDAIVEVRPPGSGMTNVRLSVRVEFDESVGPWFAWAEATADGIVPAAESAGLRHASTWSSHGRWFVVLRKPTRGEGAT